MLSLFSYRPFIPSGVAVEQSDRHYFLGFVSRLFPDGAEQEEEEPGAPPDVCEDDDLDLSGAEQKQVGGLAWRVYQTYWVAVGGVLAASILMSLLLMQGLDQPLGLSV